MTSILDFHTHRLDATGALISVDPRHFEPKPGLYYSVGYHPWDDVDRLTDDDFSLLERCASHPQVLALGETGMDALRGADLERQADAFVRHLQLADKLGKPVVAHNVRTTQQLLAARRHSKLEHVPLAIHGMRGNAHVARKLLDADCYLSLGPRFNATALKVVPTDRLLIETDDAEDVTIDTVAARVAAALGQPVENIITMARDNVVRFLSR